MRYLLLFLLCYCATVLPVMDLYTAQRAYREGNFQKAHDLYNSLLVDSPYNAELLFNAGDTAYRLEEYEQAGNYFKNAAQHETVKEKRQQALFNAGNALFYQEKYQEAIDYYIQVLEIDKNHEKALNNKYIAEQKLKEQEEQRKQQEQKKQQDQEQKDQENNKDNADKKEDQEKNFDNKQKDEEQSSDQQQNNQQNQKSDSSESQQSSDHSDGQSNDSEDNSKGQQNQRNSQSNKEQDGQNTQQDEQQNGSGQADNQTGGATKQREDFHKTPSLDQNNPNKIDQAQNSHDQMSDAGKDTTHAGQDQPQNSTAKKEPLQAVEVSDKEPSEDEKKEPEFKLLKYIEQADQNTTKDLLKRQLQKKGQDTYGQKNW